MKRFIFLALLLLASRAGAEDRTTPLSRALADALYCKVAGNCTVQNFTITGTCTGCGGGAPSYPLFMPAGTTAAPTLATSADHTTGWHFTATAFVWGSGGTNNNLVCGQGCATVSGGTYGWSSSATDATAAADTTIARAGAKSINVGVGGDATGTVNAATFVGALTGTASGNLVSGGALGTPSSGVATNLTGTAAGLTAGTVTTNANLTGPITSTGNATAVASQTGTGSKFVMDTSPTLGGLVTVGAGGTGTDTQEVKINSGNGSAATAIQSFYRNSVRKAYIGVSSAGNLIGGDNADQLAITSASQINFSIDNGTSIKASVSSTGLSVSGPVTGTTLVSNVATGTAPLTVSSTTQVSNLNVSQLVGATWVAPGTIGSSTPNTAAFTSLAAGGAKWNVDTNGKQTISNNLTLAGMGSPLILGVTSQKAETTAADANVLTVTPTTASTYKVCVAISVASATSGVISWTLSWTDSNSNAQSNIAQQLFQMGTAAPNTTFTTSSAGNYHGCSVIDTGSTASIIVKWVGGGTTSAKMSAWVERIN